MQQITHQIRSYRVYVGCIIHCCLLLCLLPLKLCSPQAGVHALSQRNKHHQLLATTTPERERAACPGRGAVVRRGLRCGVLLLLLCRAEKKARRGDRCSRLGFFLNHHHHDIVCVCLLYYTTSSIVSPPILHQQPDEERRSSESWRSCCCCVSVASQQRSAGQPGPQPAAYRGTPTERTPPGGIPSLLQLGSGSRVLSETRVYTLLAHASIDDEARPYRYECSQICMHWSASFWFYLLRTDR